MQVSTFGGRTSFSLTLLLTASLVAAHEHDDSIPPDPSVPIDSVLKLHVFLQMLSWGMLFPAGMVLGMVKSRWHVPVQVLATVLTSIGFFLGHHHGGRTFYEGAHSHFAVWTFWQLLIQASLGFFLKTHLYDGTLPRRLAVHAHSFLGKTFPLVGWLQIVFGFITGLGFCFGEFFGQCLAHFIMGSSFIAYGVVLLVMMRSGAGWLARRKVSQEMIDSTVMCVWGIVNTFTEHDFLRPSGYWSHKDMQHVSLGVIWWAGGALGIWLSRHQKRNILPGLLIILTGFAMSAHEQPTMLQTKVHQVFGLTLMAAGLARIIEVSFVLRDEPTTQNGVIWSFQHSTPLLLVVSGVCFMSATEEQLAWISSLGMDHVTYSLVIFTFAFLIYLYASLLISLQKSAGRNADHDYTHRLSKYVDWIPAVFDVINVNSYRRSGISANKPMQAQRLEETTGYAPVNGDPETGFRHPNGHARPRSSIEDEVDGLESDAVELDDAYWAEK